jgi:Protein of unknown function (DUF3105)
MRHLVSALFGTLALGLTACGGSDSSTPSTSSTPSSPSSGASTETSTPPTPSTIATDAPPDGAPEGVVDFGEFSQDHVGQNVEYEQSPPVGGPHFPVWQTCDFYDTTVPNEQGVHSLEHGAVWITYSPDLADDQLDTIQSLADGEREVLASLYEGLPSPVVASAWGLQLELDSALDPALAQFVDYYENGPQTPEANTPCAGGTP